MIGSSVTGAYVWSFLRYQGTLSRMTMAGTRANSIATRHNAEDAIIVALRNDIDTNQPRKSTTDERSTILQPASMRPRGHDSVAKPCIRVLDVRATAAFQPDGRGAPAVRRQIQIWQGSDAPVS